MSHNSLANYYKIIFGLITKYNFSYSDIENMIIFERDIFVALILENNNH